jgi:hypothetical protein
MQYENLFDLYKMIENAFEEEEIKSIIQNESVDTDYIKKELKQKYKDILKNFSASIEKIENLEKKKSILELNLKKEHPILYALFNYIKISPISPKFGIRVIVLFAVLTFSYFVYLLRANIGVLDSVLVLIIELVSKLFLQFFPVNEECCYYH